MRSLWKMRFWSVFALTTGLLGASPAWAQKPREDASMTEARQRYNEGIKLADESNHEAARLKFSQAWMLLKSPAILFNLARSEQLSGHLVEALEHFRLFVSLGADSKVTEQQRERAKELATEITGKVGQVEVDAARNSQIAIDGRPVEWTPQAEPIAVMPGSHEVTATLEGKTTRVTVEATAGAIAKAKLRSEAPPPPPAAAPPASAPPPEKSERAWSTGQTAGLAIAGGGLVAAGLGFYFHVDSSNAGDDADGKLQHLGTSGCRGSLGAAKPAECASLADLRDQQDRSAAIRNGLWIGGGALVIGGAALFLWSGRRSQERAWHVVPSVSPKSGGLAVVGAF